VALPANANSRADRVSRLSPLRLSMLAPATDKMVVSRSALVGFCLTSFAGGIVMTLAVDRAHTRAVEPPRESDPIVLKTTPLDPAADLPRAPAPVAAAPAPAALAPATPAAVAPAPAPAATRVPAAPVATASPAAAEAVVVQLSPPQRIPLPLPAPAAHAARKVAVEPPAAHAARKVAVAAPVVRGATPRKRTSATVESSPTEAAPAEDPVLPATTKKKWSDPFAP
jgi:hypothetical protein